MFWKRYERKEAAPTTEAGEAICEALYKNAGQWDVETVGFTSTLTHKPSGIVLTYRRAFSTWAGDCESSLRASVSLSSDDRAAIEVAVRTWLRDAKREADDKAVQSLRNAIEARRAETTGSVEDESAVGKADAPNPHQFSGDR